MLNIDKTRTERENLKSSKLDLDATVVMRNVSEYKDVTIQFVK